MARPGRPSAGDRVAFPLRIDPVVMEAVKGSAEQDIRSVNAQIEALLRESLRRRGYLKTPAKPEEPSG